MKCAAGKLQLLMFHSSEVESRQTKGLSAVILAITNIHTCMCMYGSLQSTAAGRTCAEKDSSVSAVLGMGLEFSTSQKTLMCALGVN